MLLLVEPDHGLRAKVASVLPAGLQVLHADTLADVDAAVDAGAEVVFLGPGVPASDALAQASLMRVERPWVGFVMLAEDIDVRQMQEALRGGVRDVLPVACAPEQAAAAIERIRSVSSQMKRPDQAPSQGSERRVVTVFSSKGGVGKSLVAANLAVALARRGEPVALVDLDLQFGDLAIMLQLFPARTIAEAASVAPNLDVDALEGYLAEHRSGVRLLAAPFEPGLAETVAPDGVTHILRLLRSAFRYVVIDTPAALNEHVISAIDESDRTILIGSMDVPSIKNMKLALQTLTLLDVPRERLHLVLNRADSEVGLRVNEVEKTLGTRVEVSIPSGREVPLSINRGVPLMLEAPGSPVVAALRELTTLVTGSDEPALAATTKEGGWLRRRSR